MSGEPTSTVSSGNPYADLGMADAKARLAKARLAQKITAVMREQNLTQAALAEKLGVDQPRVSLIVRGQLKAFSLDRLMELVNRLNLDIEIRVTQIQSPRGQHTRWSATRKKMKALRRYRWRGKRRGSDSARA